MATKTVSLTVEAYERLRRARRAPGESFTDVVLRARWPEQTITGRELLERSRTRGPMLPESLLDEAELVSAEDRPPEDKWSRS